jgi:tetratricopeptide (TPR) repeat protein
MADIFISYASEDRARVRPLAEALLARGFNIWWDRSLSAGQDYTAIIERELKSAKAVIVVWTQASTHSTFVRDEAGRARDEGRLVPVSLDKVDIPLGFGSYQAEDFSNWNGGANAPQVQLLEEVLKAKLAGRDVDSAAIERRRRKLGGRIRMVSLLTVLALVIGIAAGGRYLIAPPDTEVTQEDLRAELLRLLAEGKLTPEQAIQLAGILESGALGETQSASLNGEQAPSSAAPSPTDSMSSREVGADAAITEASFDAAARESYQQAFLAVAQHPDAQVRLAAAQLSQADTREAAMQTIWDYAQAHPDDPLRDDIYLLCGTVGERNASPLGQRALEISANLQPQDDGVWRMLSRSYRRTNRVQEAAAAATVSEAVEAQAQGDTAAAEQQLQEALPNLQTPALQATVVGELGQIAERRNDWTSASARFAESYRLREQAAAAAPNSPTADAGLEANAQQLVIALDRSGRTREACERLRQAQEAHDVAAPDQELLNRCQTQFRTQLRPRVELAPQLQRQRIAPQRTAPATP